MRRTTPARSGKLSSIYRPTIPAEGKAVIRNEDGGFDMYLDARYIGSRLSYGDCWAELNRLEYETLRRTQGDTADAAADYAALMAA